LIEVRFVDPSSRSSAAFFAFRRMSSASDALQHLADAKPDVMVVDL